MDLHAYPVPYRSRLAKTALSLLAFTLLLAACFAGTAKASAATDLLIINKKTNTLGYFSGGKLVKTFRVATGKTKELTPEGRFPIVVKVKNRPYYKEHIPGGDPANPLGDRWLGLKVNGTMGTTYAIHGNNNESSIGKYVSAGCIRMHNDDIRWLYPRIATQTMVIITSSGLDMQSIAVKSGYPLGQTLVAGSFVRDGETIIPQSPFLIEQSRVFVPLRETVTLLGGSVNIDAASGDIVMKLGRHTVTHQPLGYTANVDGKSVAMLPSRNVGGRLYLPLSSLAPLFGIVPAWNPQAKAVEL